MIDEIEAIPFADVVSWDMKISADKIGIPTPSFCRILERGRKKICIAIIHGYAIKICGCRKKNTLVLYFYQIYYGNTSRRCIVSSHRW